jgi:hypothetical protein
MRFAFTSELGMLIWSGFGFLVAVITFGACLLMNWLLDAQFGEGYYSSHGWAVGSALIMGGLISSVVGILLKARHDREVVDVQTGERMVINLSQHSFFFVPMHWAGVAIAAIGVAAAVYDLLT